MQERLTDIQLRLCSAHYHYTFSCLPLEWIADSTHDCTPDMVSLNARRYTSSEQSSDSTANNPWSAQQSPKMTDGSAERNTSFDDSISQPPSSAENSCPLHDVRQKRYAPKDRRGWPSLAHVMSGVPEYAAFSRFTELNIKNLLYYQAELDILRQEIALHEEETTLNVRCYRHLVEDADSCYHGLLIKNRRLLREYSK